MYYVELCAIHLGGLSCGCEDEASCGLLLAWCLAATHVSPAVPASSAAAGVRFSPRAGWQPSHLTLQMRLLLLMKRVVAS
jgi:hypothetical protein